MRAKKGAKTPSGVAELSWRVLSLLPSLPQARKPQYRHGQDGIRKRQSAGVGALFGRKGCDEDGLSTLTY